MFCVFLVDIQSVDHSVVCKNIMAFFVMSNPTRQCMLNKFVSRSAPTHFRLRTNSMFIGHSIKLKVDLLNELGRDHACVTINVDLLFYLEATDTFFVFY